MQVTLSLTAFFCLASSAFGSSHRVPLGASNHHGLAKRAPAFTPTAPGPGDVFRAGSPITIQWDADTSGSQRWKQTTIRFMTGSNLNMTQLAVVGTIDGTDASTTETTWTAPQVDPYSAIYFFQFDHGGEAQRDPTWTTRFTVASPSGATVPPPFARQPENQDNPPIPYGVGRIIGGSGSGSDTGNSTGSDDGEDSASTASAATASTASGTPVAATASVSTTTRSSPTVSSSSSSTPTGAARPAILAHPAGLALTGAAVGLAAIFALIVFCRCCLHRRARAAAVVARRDEESKQGWVEAMPPLGQEATQPGDFLQQQQQRQLHQQQLFQQLELPPHHHQQQQQQQYDQRVTFATPGTYSSSHNNTDSPSSSTDQLCKARAF